jgi:hypothetical protein
LNCHILYVTFARDFQWTKYSLESIKKYCKGFSGVTIVVPDRDVGLFLPLEGYSTPECPVLIKNFLEYPEKGFVHHLAMKCYADVFCPKADFILHMDPDCLFHEPTTPEDYFVDGHPVLVIEPYELLKKYFPGRYNWKRVTEEALKFDCPYETMCRHPAVHYNALYPLMRQWIEATHQTPFYDFVIKQKNSFPQGFGEFNTLGAFACRFMKGAYELIDCGPAREARLPELIAKPELKIGHPNEKITQMWSYTGVNSPENQEKIQRILRS